MEKEPRVIAQEIVDDVIDYFREELEDMRKIYPYISKTDTALVRAWAYALLKEKVTDEYEVVKNAISKISAEILTGRNNSDNS